MYKRQFTINVENDIVYGDLDGDGNVTNIDAVMLLQHVAKMNLLDEALIPAANVDGVGEVTNADAVLVLQYVAKLITSFPVEEVPEVPAE